MANWPWFAGGGVLAALGLVGLCLALFGDRARGRKRCRRCGYSMEGAASLRCPECGRGVKHETDLLRTRRHPRWALLALVLMAVGGGLVLHGHATDEPEGWWIYAPKSLLIEGVGTPLGGVARAGLDARVPMGEAYTAENIISPPLRARGSLPQALSAGQWRRLSERCVTVLLRSEDAPVRPERWAAEMLYARRATGRVPWAIDLLGRVVPDAQITDAALARGVREARPGRTANILAAVANRWRHRVVLAGRGEPGWVSATVALASGERPEMTAGDRANAAAVVLLGWPTPIAHVRAIFGDGSVSACPDPVWERLMHAARRPDPYRASQLLGALRAAREEMAESGRAGAERMAALDALLLELDAVVRVNAFHGSTTWRSPLATALRGFYDAGVPIEERIAWLGEVVEDDALFERERRRERLRALVEELEEALAQRD